MKKIITFCFFAFALVLGTQTVSAQSIVEVNSLASKKTLELKKVVKFDNDTQDLVYQTYQEFVQKKLDADKLVAEGGTLSAEEKEKMNTMLTEKFKTIFTEEEFMLYEAYTESQK